MPIDFSRYGLNPRAPEVIDSSMLKDFLDCASMFYLRHVLGLRRKIRSAADVAKFDWGTTWHKVLELYHAAKLAGEAEPATRAIRWLDENFPAAIRPDVDKHGRGKERMLLILVDYLTSVEPLLDNQYETIRTEQFFDVLDPETGVRWAGRIDKISLLRSSGAPVLWDYKTTSAMQDTYFEGHEHGFQLPGYVWASNLIFSENVREIRLDVLHTLKASHKFYQRGFRYTPHHLAEWHSNVKRVLEQIHFLLTHHLEDPDAWTKNWQECTRYGFCPFTPVHFTAPIGDTRLRILSDEYIEDRWDPLNDQEAT